VLGCNVGRPESRLPAALLWTVMRAAHQRRILGSEESVAVLEGTGSKGSCELDERKTHPLALRLRVTADTYLPCDVRGLTARQGSSLRGEDLHRESRRNGSCSRTRPDHGAQSLLRRGARYFKVPIVHRTSTSGSGEKESVLAGCSAASVFVAVSVPGLRAPAVSGPKYDRKVSVPMPQFFPKGRVRSRNSGYAVFIYSSYLSFSCI